MAENGKYRITCEDPQENRILDAESLVDAIENFRKFSGSRMLSIELIEGKSFHPDDLVLSKDHVTNYFAQETARAVYEKLSAEANKRWRLFSALATILSILSLGGLATVVRTWWVQDAIDRNIPGMVARVKADISDRQTEDLKERNREIRAIRNEMGDLRSDGILGRTNLKRELEESFSVRSRAFSGILSLRAAAQRIRSDQDVLTPLARKQVFAAIEDVFSDDKISQTPEVMFILENIAGPYCHRASSDEIRYFYNLASTSVDESPKLLMACGRGLGRAAIEFYQLRDLADQARAFDESFTRVLNRMALRFGGSRPEWPELLVLKHIIEYSKQAVSATDKDIKRLVAKILTKVTARDAAVERAYHTILIQYATAELEFGTDEWPPLSEFVQQAARAYISSWGSKERERARAAIRSGPMEKTPEGFPDCNRHLQEVRDNGYEDLINSWRKVTPAATTIPSSGF